MSVRQRIPVSSIMTKNIITVSPTDGLKKAEALFQEHHIRHIPVVEGDRIIGMLSLTDLLRISFADGAYRNDDDNDVETLVYHMFTIPQVMTGNVERVAPNTTIKEVAEILTTREYHALPVVAEDQLVGIVTTTDLIKYLLDQY